MGIPKTQYHATRPGNVNMIRSRGLLLPGQVRVETHRYNIPSISTADTPEDARVYHPDGVVVVLRVLKGQKYLTRSLRSMKRGENLEESVNRWLEEAAEAGATGIYVGEGLQSTVGNQTLVLDALEVVGIL
jgi:hypothetical protein